MDWIALLGRLLLIAVFLVAAASKLADRAGSRQAVVDFGVPRRVAAPIALLLPIIELTVAALLIPGATERWGALAALALLGVFSVGIAVQLARGRAPSCHCFGQLSSAPIGASTLVRNIGLVTTAAIVALHAGESPSISSLTAAAGSSPGVLFVSLVALLALAVASLEAWLLLAMLPQQGRVLLRLESLERALGMGPVAGLPMGQPAPDLVVRDLEGGRSDLTALRASGRPVLLFFMNPTCAPCEDVLPDIARWQREYADRVTIAVISRGPVESNRVKAATHDLRTVLLQKNREVSEAYGIETTPAAVLVSGGGLLASPIAYGPEQIAQLLLRAVQGLGDDAMEHLPASAATPPAQPASSSVGNGLSAPVIGQPAPTLVLPDLDGRMIDLADARGAPALVLFWSPVCGFCQQMLPGLLEWERTRARSAPRLLIVSTGTVEANRALGFASTVVLDPEGSAMHRFGASGTPMAVLLDADGRIASPLAAGADEVMALARARVPVARRGVMA